MPATCFFPRNIASIGMQDQATVPQTFSFIYTTVQTVSEQTTWKMPDIVGVSFFEIFAHGPIQCDRKIKNACYNYDTVTF